MMLKILIILLQILKIILECRIAVPLFMKLKEKFEAYKAEIDKELEKTRAVLGNKNYITQKKFDVEFEMYQTLANSYYRLVKEATTLIPAGISLQPADPEVKKVCDQQTFEDLCKAISDTQEYLFRYAPFIQEDIYDGYNQILKLCNEHRLIFMTRWNRNDFRRQEEKESFSVNDYERTEKINKKYDEVNQLLRAYLQSLEIV